MSSSERIALEAMAAEWLERAKNREPSVRQTYETCAEQLLAMLPKVRRKRMANGNAE